MIPQNTKKDFLEHVSRQFQKEKAWWSPDACVGRAKAEGLFSCKEIVCTKTLYNHVVMGLMPITNIELPEKLKRKTKTQKVRENSGF